MLVSPPGGVGSNGETTSMSEYEWSLVAESAEWMTTKDAVVEAVAAWWRGHDGSGTEGESATEGIGSSASMTSWMGMIMSGLRGDVVESAIKIMWEERTLQVVAIAFMCAMLILFAVTAYSCAAERLVAFAIRMTLRIVFGKSSSSSSSTNGSEAGDRVEGENVVGWSRLHIYVSNLNVSRDVLEAMSLPPMSFDKLFVRHIGTHAHIYSHFHACTLLHAFMYMDARAHANSTITYKRERERERECETAQRLVYLSVSTRVVMVYTHTHTCVCVP